MAKIRTVILGIGDVAELCWSYTRHDSDLEPVAFAVDRKYVTDSEFCGLPVVPLDELPSRYPPDDYPIGLAIGYAGRNDARARIYRSVKALGYRFVSYVNSRAVVSPDARLGSAITILDNTIVQAFATLGDNIMICADSHIAHHCRIGDHTFIANGVQMGGNVTVGESAFIGIGAIIRNGVTIGERCVVGAGCIILKDLEPEGLYIARQARRVGDRDLLTEI